MAGVGEDPNIHIIVVGQNGKEVIFKMKRTTPLRRLMDVFCQHLSINRNSVSFLFQGHFLKADQTPNEVELEDHDEIHAVHPDEAAAAA